VKPPKHPDKFSQIPEDSSELPLRSSYVCNAVISCVSVQEGFYQRITWLPTTAARLNDWSKIAGS